MAIDPDELLPRKPASETVIGQDISNLSVIELEKRIADLEAALSAVEKRDQTLAAARDTRWKVA